MLDLLCALLLALAAAAAPARPAAATLPSDTVRGLRITVLYDNTVADPRLRPAWGFSALIERGGHTLLLDAGGAPDTLLPNVDSLHIALPAIEAIALSHAHGDHAGGLPGLARRGLRVPLFTLPGFPAAFREQFGGSFPLRDVGPRQELIPGVFTTGEMSDPAVGIPEQSLIIPTDSGLVIITGCAHQGITAIVQRAVDLFHQPVYLVLGGFHLLDRTDQQVDAIIAEFRRLGVRRVGATHCTGQRAIAKFAAAWGSDFVPLGVGRVVTVGNSPAAAARRPFRVAVLKLQHETCTFCPGGDVTVADWTRLGPPVSGEALFRSDGYIRGFVRQANDYGDMQLIGLTSPDEVFGGSSRSWITQETFEHFLGIMLAELRAQLPVDGVYLALHGAMGVRDVPRPEAEIARRFRALVGPGVPIAATFDLHGNEDEQFLRYADFSFVTKYYPHYDDGEQGERAARALHRTMSGTYRPTTATRRPGIITPTVYQWTGASPSLDIMERAKRWEAREPDAFVSVFYGFPWTDVPDAGTTVEVMTNGDQALADAIADDMSAYIWRVRERFASGKLPQPAEAAQLVKAAIAARQVPVAVGDHSDRPGDATHILRAFEAAGIGKVLYGAITSPATLEHMRAAGAKAGDPFDAAIGGTTESGGAPFPVRGTVAYVGPWAGYDYTAAVSFGRGNLVILVPAYTQITAPGSFRFGPVDPAAYDVFVVKSRVHFRGGFDETGFAKTVVVVEAPGPYVGTTFLDALPYRHVDLKQFYPYGGPGVARLR
ncbi:MAG: MBL fold metallo-hydrolase [Gemmatimonadetes bacterium]|nr:MBL fold metallo-hydrolase [Gemmatimonadota bacterium]